MMKTVTLVRGSILAASAAPALADAATLETLRSECAAQLNLAPPACNCIVDRAAALGDNRRSSPQASPRTKPRRRRCAGR